MLIDQNRYPGIYGLLPNPFTNLDEANAEITKLRYEIHMLRLANAELNQKKRGRPKKFKGFGFSQLSFLGKTNSSMLPRNKGGRPYVTTSEEKIEILDQLEGWKEVIKKETGKAFVSDKLVVIYLVERGIKKEGKLLRQDKKRREIEKILTFLKHCRDETGIRQRSKEKRKTQKKIPD